MPEYFAKSVDPIGGKAPSVDVDGAGAGVIRVEEHGSIGVDHEVIAHLGLGVALGETTQVAEVAALERKMETRRPRKDGSAPRLHTCLDRALGQQTPYVMRDRRSLEIERIAPGGIASSMASNRR